MEGKTPPVQVVEGQGGPGTSIDWHAVGDHYECKYSVGASRTAQVGAGCSNSFATCTWALYVNRVLPKCKLHT